MKKIAFTSITPNYLPKARVLGHSIKRHAPEVEFVLVLAEELDPSLLRPSDPFDRVLDVTQLGIEDVRQWLFGHTVVEACTAIKGHALAALLASNRDSAVIYFDPDMVITAPLDTLYGELDTASIILTPHGIAPETETRAIIDNEISHLRYGVYNLGFLGVRATASGLAFAAWWANRLHNFCYDEIEFGIFTDQRWVDLAPSLFDGVRVLRDPGYNVATWNLSHRTVVGDVNRGFQVNGRPLVFYHFSGFDSGAMETMLAAYGNQSPDLEAFRLWYVAECECMGQSELSTHAWKYGRFRNGTPINAQMRRIYRDRKDLQLAFPDPFETAVASQSFLHWYLQSLQAPTPAPLGECEVVVIVPAGFVDPGSAIRSLLQKTAQAHAVSIAADVGTWKGLQEWSHLRHHVLKTPIGTNEQYEAWVLSYAVKIDGRGLIFIRLGVQVPELWDLRLMWGAQRESRVVTASPLCDASPLTALRGDLDEYDGLDTDTTDRIVCNLNMREPVETPSPLRDCLYIDAEAAAAVLKDSQHTGGVPTTFNEMARISQLCGYSHVLLNDLYVDAGSPERIKATTRGANTVNQYIARNVLGEVRDRFRAITSADTLPTPAQLSARRLLHVTHNWGGGLEHWVRSYCDADRRSVNIILRPVGERGRYGSEYQVTPYGASAAIERWAVPVPVKATIVGSTHQRKAIARIINEYGIEALYVSSLIGHSMDILRTGLPTVFICHDYFPITPSIYLRSGDITGNRLGSFSLDHVYSQGPPELFPNFTKEEARAAYRSFNEIAASRTVKFIAPSPSTRAIHLDALPGLHEADIVVIPHGTADNLHPIANPSRSMGNGRLRLVVPGRLAPEKGMALLGAILPELASFADVLLLGGGLEASHFEDIPGVRSVASYHPDDLGALLQEFSPHLGLLVSDFPETFSYTLDELQAFGIPPLAVSLGSFVDRIVDGSTGFLVERDAKKVIGRLREIDSKRHLLTAVRKNLAARQTRTEQEMVFDYEALLGLPTYSARAFYAPGALPPSAYENISLRDARGYFNDTPSTHGQPPASLRPRARRRRMPEADYRRLIRSITDATRSAIAPSSVIAVLSRGDEQFLKALPFATQHFPATPSGTYLGHHPANSDDAIAHLVAAIDREASYLLVPDTARWWLDHYDDFASYLNGNFAQVLDLPGVCVLFDLRPAGAADDEPAGPRLSGAGRRSRKGA